MNPRTILTLLVFFLTILTTGAAVAGEPPAEKADAKPTALSAEEVAQRWSSSDVGRMDTPSGRDFTLFTDGTFHLIQQPGCRGREGEKGERLLVDAVGRWTLAEEGVQLKIEAQRVATAATCVCHQEIPRAPCYFELEEMKVEKSGDAILAKFTSTRHPDRPDAATLDIGGTLFTANDFRHDGNAETFYNNSNPEIPEAYLEVHGCRRVEYESDEGEAPLIRVRCGE